MHDASLETDSIDAGLRGRGIQSGGPFRVSKALQVEIALRALPARMRRPIELQVVDGVPYRVI